MMTRRRQPDGSRVLAPVGVHFVPESREAAPVPRSRIDWSTEPGPHLWNRAPEYANAVQGED